MERICAQKPGFRDRAILVLSWITCAERRLTSSELQHALAMEAGDEELDEDNILEVGEAVSVCAGLVIVDKESDVVGLVHYTTQEYLERTQDKWFPNAQANIATTCVTYLSFKTFESGWYLSEKEFDARLRLNPLYDYAARYWCHHVRKASLDLEQSTLDFLECGTKVTVAYQALHSRFSFPPGLGEARQKTAIGLHYVAYSGLANAASQLLKNGHDPQREDAWGFTPLLRAVQEKNMAVIQLFLAHPGVDLNSLTVSGYTPLSLAARLGYKEVVQLLLTYPGIDPNSNNIFGEAPLFVAAGRGHEEVVQLLLPYPGIDP